MPGPSLLPEGSPCAPGVLRRSLRLVLLLALPMARAAGQASSPDAPPGTAADSIATALVQQYRSIAEAKFLRRDPVPLGQAAHPHYVVLTPNGRIEERAQALGGVANFRLDSLRLGALRVRADVPQGHAVLTGELWLHGFLEGRTPDGALRRVSLTGPYGVLAVFVRAGAAWQLVAESVTPLRPPGPPHGDARSEAADRAPGRPRHRR